MDRTMCCNVLQIDCNLSWEYICRVENDLSQSFLIRFQCFIARHRLRSSPLPSAIGKRVFLSLDDRSRDRESAAARVPSTEPFPIAPLWTMHRAAPGTSLGMAPTFADSELVCSREEECDHSVL